MPSATAPQEHKRATAVDLAARIASGETSVAAAVDACLQQLERRNPSLNAVSQPLCESARRDAARADARVSAGEPLGPLHGVPVTIKDCFAVEGAETTLGIHGFCSGPDAADSPLVRRLRAAGAIVIGKTNVPQGMLLHECENPLFGRTLHPDDPERSPGGSSGGEAAAVAAGMSLLGLASDLGGSTRQPAHSCGLVGFKPTSHRLTTVGSRRVMVGMRSLTIQPGPIAHTTADAELMMRVLLDDQAAPRQPDERPEPWPDYRRVDVSSLRVACWTDNGIARPAAAIARAVHDAAERLRGLGADVRAVAAPLPDEMLRVYFGLISADGLRTFAELLNGRPKTPQVRRQVRIGTLPRSARAVLGPALRAAGQPALARLVALSGPRSAYDYWRLTNDADAFKPRFWAELDRAFDGKPVDAVLGPPHSLPALRHGSALHLLLEGSHCYLANLLDAPAGVVPAGRVTADEERQELASCTGRWAVDDRLRRLNAEGSTGLPVGVQVMARPWRDDVALALMSALEAP